MNPKDIGQKPNPSLTAGERIAFLAKKMKQQVLADQIQDHENEIQEQIAARKKYQEQIDRISEMQNNIFTANYMEAAEDIEAAEDMSINSHEEADALNEDAILLDADGYVFQRRNGQWFMAGAQFGSEDFSGSFPAKELTVK